MGYDFSFAEPQPGDRGYGLNAWQMQHMRLLLVEAGAAAGGGLQRLFDEDERFAPAAGTVPVEHFSSNDDWRISAAQSAFVGARLRAAVAGGLVGEMALFYEDQPDELETWAGEFAAFNERAADRGGYRVR